jgi:hypothetical protein
MSSNTYDIVLWNKNHSHPEFPSGYFKGNLTVDKHGLVFLPKKPSYPNVVIHYDNVTSTYTEVFQGPRMYDFAGDRTEYVMLALAFGRIQPYLSHLSVKFKLVDFDKICVIGFCSSNLLPFFGSGWAEHVETDIWNYKRNLRSERHS